MEILAMEKAFAVCLKPVGMDAEQDVPQALSEASGRAFSPAHRLDKNVAGLMLCVAPGCGGAVKDFEKEYVALVHGTPESAGDWTDHLFKDSRKNKVFAVKKPRPGAKEARLAYVRLTAGEQSLVKVHLYTGRTHQIRVQFASRGFPLVGDHKYGSRAEETSPMLFCSRLQFTCGGKKYDYRRLPQWAEGGANEG